MVEIVYTLPNYTRKIVSPTCAQKLSGSGTKTSKIIMSQTAVLKTSKLHYKKALLDNVFDGQLYIDSIF